MIKVNDQYLDGMGRLHTVTAIKPDEVYPVKTKFTWEKHDLDFTGSFTLEGMWYIANEEYSDSCGQSIQDKSLIIPQEDIEFEDNNTNTEESW